MKPQYDFDLIVVGAGAAGLMAAASGAAAGVKTLLLEKNRKLGVKILMSGGTRCNITHACDSRGIVEAFGRNGRFLHSALASLSPQDVIQKVESLGVATKRETTGKIFPVSNRAIDVRDALVRMAVDAGAVIQNESPVIRLERQADGFQIRLGGGNSLQSRFVLITTGGKSYPGCGTTGDGYEWAQQFGHSMVRPIPALTPILCNQSWANQLKGVTIEDVGLDIFEKSIERERSPSDSPVKKKKKRKPLVSVRNSFLFTHFGFSGPAPLNASHVVSGHMNRKALEIVCDWLPSSNRDEFFTALSRRVKQEGKQMVGNLLPQFVPRRLAECLLEQAAVDPREKNAQLSKSALTRLVDAVKQTRLTTTGTLGFEKAEVTAGGISLKEVDSRTMESKMVPGLFFAGEVLDLDGPIGGFNFQSAFSTGWLAGQSIARALAQRNAQNSN